MARLGGWLAPWLWWLTGLVWCTACSAGAQPVRITRFVPGPYLSTNQHRVELRNGTGQPLNLGGWLVVTRDYSFRFPAPYLLPPRSTLTLVKNPQPGLGPSLVLSRQPDFLIRLYRKAVQGNYVVLFNDRLQWVDGFYHSELPNVPFLPDTGTLVLSSQPDKAIRFELPPETYARWGYFQLGDDPAIGFEHVNGQWRVTSARRSGASLYSPTQIQHFQGRYLDRQVVLSWTTSFEDRVNRLVVERSTDQYHFMAIATVEPRGSSANPTPYRHLDPAIQPERTYYYRVVAWSNADPNPVYTPVIEVRTTRIPIEFWLDCFPAQAISAQQLNISVYSAYSQVVDLRLYDSRMAELQRLYTGLVYAEEDHILRFRQPLSPGTYHLLARVGRKRYHRTFRITGR